MVYVENEAKGFEPQLLGGWWESWCEPFKANGEPCCLKRKHISVEPAVGTCLDLDEQIKSWVALSSW